MLREFVDVGDENTGGLSSSARVVQNAWLKLYKLAGETTKQTFELWQKELLIDGFRGEISHLTIREWSR